MQVPEYRVDSLDALQHAVDDRRRAGRSCSATSPTVGARSTPVFVTHTNVQPTYNVRADVQDADLGRGGRAARADRGQVPRQAAAGSDHPCAARSRACSEGFARPRRSASLFAALLVYALMVINFQSWLDPFIILMALPGAGVGHRPRAVRRPRTTFSIPSLMGAIMSIGVATANSILVVTFANEQRDARAATR